MTNPFTVFPVYLLTNTKQTDCCMSSVSDMSRV